VSAVPVLRLLNVGVSSREPCGVRDYAAVLGRALKEREVEVASVWRESADESRDGWLRRVETAAVGADWILWHYSVFNYGSHGVPYDAPLIARRLSGIGPRVALIAHEYALPFGRRGLKGFVHAATQRAVLGPVLRRADAIVVTVDSRRQQLTRLGRPIAAQPVFSNLPQASNGRVIRGTIGVFGYGSEDFHADLTARAIAALGRDVRVVLLGAPGPGTPAAHRWRTAFAAVGRADALEVTGILPPDEAARRLGSVEVVLFPDRWGPSARKTTLAAALAAGAPVVAVDGPERWDELVDAGGVALAAQEPGGVADRLGALLGDPDERSAQGRRGREFYESRMTPGHAAEAVLGLIGAAQ
jgi:glycosyltransferase involved in cell wall biosynthesis